MILPHQSSCRTKYQSHHSHIPFHTVYVWSNNVPIHIRLLFVGTDHIQDLLLEKASARIIGGFVVVDEYQIVGGCTTTDGDLERASEYIAIFDGRNSETTQWLEDVGIPDMSRAYGTAGGKLIVTFNDGSDDTFFVL